MGRAAGPGSRSVRRRRRDLAPAVQVESGDWPARGRGRSRPQGARRRVRGAGRARRGRGGRCPGGEVSGTHVRRFPQRTPLGLLEGKFRHSEGCHLREEGRPVSDMGRRGSGKTARRCPNLQPAPKASQMTAPCCPPGSLWERVTALGQGSPASPELGPAPQSPRPGPQPPLPTPGPVTPADEVGWGQQSPPSTGLDFRPRAGSRQGL